MPTKENEVWVNSSPPTKKQEEEFKKCEKIKDLVCDILLPYFVKKFKNKPEEAKEIMLRIIAGQ